MLRLLRVSRARRFGLLAFASLAFAFAWPMQGGGSLQNAHYVLVKALSNGTATIDDVLGEVDTGTNDTASHDGHLYSNKAPGLAALTLPVYLVLREAGAATVGDPARMLWALGLLGVVAPAVALLLLVRRVTDRLEPGLGTACAVVLGLGTLLLPFATLFFSHALSALLVFAAFALLLEGPRPALAAAAGLLGGLSVVVEYPNALLVAIVGLLALARPPRIPRAAAYAAGVVVGAAPLVAFNLWAFGSPTQSTYDPDETRDAADLFATPSVDVFVQIFLSQQGLLVISPVLACALVGIALLWRRGARAEAAVIAATTIGLAGMSAAFYAPFGGFSPGPRYLIPALPFLAVALAPALRAAPVVTGALAAVSAAAMVLLTVTHPLAGYDGRWADRLEARDVPLTAASLAGVTGWYAIVPFVAACALAGWLGLRSVERVRLRPLETPVAGLAVLAWAVVAATVDDGGAGRPAPWALLGLVVAAAVLALAFRRAADARRVRGRMALR